MEFDRDITKLKDEDLPRYKDFLFSKILEDQPPDRREESFRCKILSRIEKINKEIVIRNGSRERNK